MEQPLTGIRSPSTGFEQRARGRGASSTFQDNDATSVDRHHGDKRRRMARAGSARLATVPGLVLTAAVLAVLALSGG
jgi:hypothetical protein